MAARKIGKFVSRPRRNKTKLFFVESVTFPKWHWKASKVLVKWAVDGSETLEPIENIRHTTQFKDALKKRVLENRRNSRLTKNTVETSAGEGQALIDNLRSSLFSLPADQQGLLMLALVANIESLKKNK
jgi:hypothetical protein